MLLNNFQICFQLVTNYVFKKGPETLPLDQIIGGRSKRIHFLTKTFLSTYRFVILRLIWRI